MKAGKKYLAPIIFLVIFEAVAVTLWLTKNNLFYLFNRYLNGVKNSKRTEMPDHFSFF